MFASYLEREQVLILSHDDRKNITGHIILIEEMTCILLVIWVLESWFIRTSSPIGVWGVHLDYVDVEIEGNLNNICFGL